MSDKECITTKELGQISNEIFINLQMFHCSKCLGSILTASLMQLLVNAPSEQAFQKCKAVALELISDLQWKTEGRQ